MRTFRGVRIADWGMDANERQLTIHGGGCFSTFEGDGPPDDGPNEETRAEAQRYASQCGMVIDSAIGDWEGYSEYTPDPGNISIFAWHQEFADAESEMVDLDRRMILEGPLSFLVGRMQYLRGLS